MSQKRGLVSSFGFALEGIKEAFQNEPNFRIHSLMAGIALFLAYLLKFSRIEWTLLLFTIAFVLIMELFNTILEKVVDLASPRISKKAKIAKDVSAAAVLLSAILAVVVGIVLFGPRILDFLQSR